MIIYVIKHLYDVDGGFGDAITREEILGAVTDKAKAEEYVAKYSKPEVYAKPYDELWHHELIIEKMEINNLNINENPWEEEE